jgi:chemotaxis protein methyltransferase CheR
MSKTQIESVDKYLERVQTDSDEWVAFLDAVSTNHTYFFRESHNFSMLSPSHRNIWCAASSSGEEPYSILIHCLENGFCPRVWATDISTEVLRIASSGIYSMDRVKNLPTALLHRYFQKGKGKSQGKVRVKKELMGQVAFDRHNLLTDIPPSTSFEVIFCRNVMIYFDKPIREKVTRKLFRCLTPNGYLVVGGAESLSGIHHGLKYVSPSVYRKAG